MRWRHRSGDPGRLVDDVREQLLTAVDTHARQTSHALARLQSEVEFMAYCAADLKDQMACLRNWPLTVAGRVLCGAPGCHERLDAGDGSDENLLGILGRHVLAEHPADFKVMRRPFEPPGWHSDNGETWFPDTP